MKDRFKFIPAVYLYLRNEEGKVLLARRYNTGYRDGYYSMVAGHLDGDESLTVALAREAKEEAGIIVKPSDMKLVKVMHLRSEQVENRLNGEYVTFYFEARRYKGTPTIMEADKCDDMGWFDPRQLPSPMINHVEIAIRDIEEGRLFSEFGW